VRCSGNSARWGGSEPKHGSIAISMTQVRGPRSTFGLPTFEQRGPAALSVTAILAPLRSGPSRWREFHHLDCETDVGDASVRAQGAHSTPPFKTMTDVPMSGYEITVATMEAPSLRSLSTLWSTQSEITLGAEHIAVKACDPLPPP
jgi:hypothetical protein